MREWQGWALGAFLMVAGGTAGAEAPADGIVRQLQEQGYTEFTVTRTWLGRIQVMALAPDGTSREIVFSPGTGEILRDYVEAADGGSATPRIMDRPAGGSNRDVRANGASEDGRGAGQGNRQGQGGGQGRGQGQGQGNGGGQGNGNGNGGGQGQGSGGGQGQGQGNGGSRNGGN